MARPELAHLELLAEVDALVEALKHWSEQAPAWGPARACRALVHRLVERTDLMRVRLEAPLVVATLGGTGTGKSALVNALVGADVTQAGRARPTTQRPILICRPGITPETLGITSDSVEWVHRELPALRDLVILDCPDPDTSEAEAPGTNLARLREILPHCDVLLVTGTQQKYRSARVLEELAAAAAGARLVFVQTHADLEQDIRKDWEAVLQQEEFATGHIFLVDSLAALADAQNGLAPRGEFAALLDLLTRQLAGSTALRIRRANFLDLVSDTLNACKTRIHDGLPAVAQVRTAIDEQRARLSNQLAGQMRDELLASRRQWESRLVGKAASRWGFSPFALVLRIYQGLGSLLSGALLLRARTPAQVALWGAVEGVRAFQRIRSQRQADASAQRALAGVWAPGELRGAALVLDGYAAEADLDRRVVAPETVANEAAVAGQAFVVDVSVELEALLDRVAQRHTGWFTRWRYDLLLLAMLGFLLYRPAKNFFYDSWLSTPPEPLYGLNFYVLSLFWLALWAGLLLWTFTGRLRRGLRREVNQLAEGWLKVRPSLAVFAQLESQCAQVEEFDHQLARLQQQVAILQHRLTLPDEKLGHSV